MKTKIISVILLLNITAMSTQPALAQSSSSSSKQGEVQKAKSSSAKKQATKAGKPKTNAALNARLSTDIQFDGQLVGGKIQAPFESLAVVENEKAIDDLIGVRTNFSDRSQKSKGMR